MKTLIVAILAIIAGTGSGAAEEADDFMGIACSIDQASCDRTQDDFRKWFRDAYKGDYQSQRNVAYCLSSGCDGAIMQTPIKGCAWRIVIVGSGDENVDQSDTGNLEFECGKLTPVEREAAAAQATRIMKKIGY